MLASLPEQTLTDVREDVQKHMDTNERKNAHGEYDQRKLGKMRDGMERLVGNRSNEFFRGPRMTFSTSFYLIRTKDR